MPPDLLSSLLTATDDAPRDVAVRMGEALPQLGALLAIDVLVAATVVGLALTVLLFAPERHRAACERLGRAPIASLLLGLVVMVLGVGLCAVSWAHHRPGHRLVLVLVSYALAGGLSVTARLLGARVLPDRGPVVQTLLGVAALLLPCATLLGAPVAVVAAAFGLGGWLTASRR